MQNKYLEVLILLLTCASSIERLTDRIIPKAKRCWYANIDAGDLSSRFVQEFEQATHSIVLYTSQNRSKQSEIANRTNLMCDSYLFIRQSIEGIKNLWEDLDFRRINNSVIVDTRLILAYEGNDDASDIEIKQLLSETLMNVVILRIPELKKEAERFLFTGAAIRDLYASAPFLGRTEVLRQKSPEMNPDLENLFKMQAWNPKLRGGTLRIAYRDEHYPFMRKTSATVYEGFEYDIIAGLAKDWKVKYTGFYEFQGEAAGRIWWESSDMEKLMISGRADLIVSGLCVPISYDEKTVVRPYIDASIFLLVPKPRPLDPAKYLYLPLRGRTWLCSVITFIAISFILNFLAKFDVGTTMRYLDTPYRQLSYCFITMFSITCGHGVLFPRPTILRTILVIWTLASLLSLRWSLSNDSEANCFLYEIIRHSDIGSGPHRFIDNADPFPISQKESSWRIHSLRYGQFGRSIGRKLFTDLAYSNPDILDIMEVMDSYVQYCPMNFLRAPRSPFRHVFYSRLSAAIETGLVSQWLERFIRKDKSFLDFDRMLVKEDVPVAPLTIDNIRGVFSVLLAGLFLATCSWLTETFCGRRNGE